METDSATAPEWHRIAEHDGGQAPGWEAALERNGNADQKEQSA